MIHYKDLSWSENPEILSKYKKNQKVKCKVVEIDLEKALSEALNEEE